MDKKFFVKFKLIFILVAACLLTSSLIVYGSWNPPSMGPPGGNVSRPLHVGSEGQEKAGGLWLNTGGAATGLIVEHGNVGIGTASPGARLDVRGGLFINQHALHSANINSYLGGGEEAKVGEFAIPSNSREVIIQGIVYGNVSTNSATTEFRINVGRHGGADDSFHEFNRVSTLRSGRNIQVNAYYKSGESSRVMITMTPSSEVYYYGYRLWFNDRSGEDFFEGVTSHTPVVDLTGWTEIVPSEGILGITFGDVGIGTISPAQRLHVAGYTRSDSGFCIGTDCITEWYDAPSDIITGTGTTNYIPRWTGISSVDNSAIYQSGSNIGIGTTSPGTRLDVIGTIKSSQGYTVDGNAKTLTYQLHNSTSSAGDRYIGQFTGSQSGRIKIIIIGQSGYGAGSFGGEAVIYGQFNNNNTLQGQWYSLGRSGNNIISDVKLERMDDNDYRIYITHGSYFEAVVTAEISRGVFIPASTLISPGTYTSLARKLTISSGVAIGYESPGTAELAVANNVGIGTTSPAQKLHVIGNVRADTGFCIGTSCITAWPEGEVTGTGTANYVPLWTTSSNIGNSAIYQSGSNIGIGTTSPGYKLQIGSGTVGDKLSFHSVPYGMGYVATGVTGVFANNDYASARVALGFQDATAFYEKVSVIQSGNVGIGTTSPAQKLHVVGYARADSGFCIGTSCITAWPQGEVTGSGTANYIPRWTTSSNIGNSAIYQSGTNIGIGTTNPQGGFHINTATGRQIVAGNWVDVSGADGGYGLLGGNMYLNKSPTAFKYSVTHASIGAMGFVVNYPWNTASIITSGTTSATAGVEFTPVSIATFRYDGNVGIGTTSPAQKLHVAGYARADSGFCIGTSCITAWPQGEVTGSGTANYIPRWTTSSNIGNSVIYQSGTNIGIGTTSPTQQLQLSGNIKANSAEFGNGIRIGSGFGSGGTQTIHVYNNDLFLQYNNNQTDAYVNIGGQGTSGNLRMRNSANVDNILISSTGNSWFNAGNVGIGTTSPAQKLHVAGYARADSGFCIGTSCITAWPQGEVTGSGTTNYIPRWTTSSNIGNSAIYQSGSNVGIGTTSPGSKLEVVGDIATARTNKFKFLENVGGGERASINSGCEGGDLGCNYLHFNVNAGDFAMTIRESGSVGVGTTSPAQKLHVAGYARADSGFCIGTSCITAWPQGEVTGSGTTNYIPLWTTSSNIGNSAIYQSGSNIGIGTTSPGAKLDAYFTGGLSATDGVQIRHSAGGFLRMTSNTSNSMMAPMLWGQSSYNIATVGGLLIQGEAAADDVDQPAIVLRARRTGVAGNTLNSPVLQIRNWTDTLFTILPGGSVGIGISSPGERLSVYDGSSTSGDIASFFRNVTDGNRVNAYIGKSKSSGGSGILQAWPHEVDPNEARLHFGIAGDSVNTGQGLVVAKTGVVGINPDLSELGNIVDNGLTKLTVRGGVHIGNVPVALAGPSVAIGDYGWLSHTGGAFDGASLNWLNAQDWRLYVLNGIRTSGEIIAETGPVGIGLTSPQELLDVDGNVRAHEYYYSSDASLKMGIGHLPREQMLSKVLKLQGVSFSWKENGKESIGFIAQDVEKIFPEIIATDSNGLKSIEYAKLLAPLVEAVKEQQSQIEQLKAEIQGLKK